MREDESAGHLYGFIGTGALPLLTSDNITSFINSSRPSAVAFYVPCKTYGYNLPILSCFFSCLLSLSPSLIYSLSYAPFFPLDCLQCRPMLLHLISFYEVKDENGKDFGMSISNSFNYLVLVQVGVVNCAAYPDVCASFKISVYPSIKIRFVKIQSDNYTR